MMNTTKKHRENPFDSSDLSRIGVVIPTFNAARLWGSLREAIDRQDLQPQQILIVDSSSTDGTRELAESAGYKVLRIEQREFSHGGTRRLATQHLPWAKVLIFMTQDSIPASEVTFRRIYEAFENSNIGAAYGRQLPRAQAGPIERHARLFNYPSESRIQTYSCRDEQGLKAAFISNSFAAYRCSALRKVGGFPSEAIVGEDSVVACRLLIASWSIAYVADAEVVHSHCFTKRKEFSRYFDIGVHHAREKWILEHFGKANDEGKRFLRSEFAYLRAGNTKLIPSAMIRTAIKLLAYQLGRREEYLPWKLKLRISGQPTFWNQMHPARVYRETPVTLPKRAQTSIDQSKAIAAAPKSPVEAAPLNGLHPGTLSRIGVRK